MRTKITVGDVEVEVEGLDLTTRQVAALLDRAASVARAVEHEEEPETRAHVGFSAQVELDPERNFSDVDPDWFDGSVPPPAAP